MALRREDALPLVAALPALALFTWWAADGGGYFAVQWLPGTLVLVWLLVVLTAITGATVTPSRGQAVALAALAAYTAWSFASIGWARTPGVALEGSQRTLLYLAAFALPALLPWTPRAARAALVGFVAATTVIGMITLFRAASAHAVADVFIDGRLVAPTGYQNASAALWTMAALPALMLAMSPALTRPVRPPLLAAAGFLFGLAILAQSRGWLFTLPIVALVALVIGERGNRPRIVVYALPVLAAVGTALPRVLEPYAVAGGRPAEQVAGNLRDAAGPAAMALVWVAVALLLLGAGLVWAEGRLLARAADSPSFASAVRRAGVGLLVAVACAGLAAVAVATRLDPIGRAETAWTDFKDFRGPQSAIGTSRFRDLSSVRYDFWDVGLQAWRAHPLTGLGQDNFAATYVGERATPAVEARWLHSIELRALVHTGLVGAALLLVFIIAAAAAALRVRGGMARGAGVVALLPAVVWLTHGSVDWLWEYPALSGPALAFAGVATSLARSQPAKPLSRRARIGMRSAAIVLATVATLVVVPAYLAERHVRRALNGWGSGPAAAFSGLDRAQRLNPLDAHPALVEGLIAAELGRTQQARAAFAEAAGRDPTAWLVPFELGLLASADGDRVAALRHFARARARNPLGTTIAEALRRADSERPMSRSQAGRSIALESARQQGQFGPVP